jgi:protein-disulfide isomerase
LIEVKVFGSEPPCVKCKKVEEAAKKAAEDFPGQVTVEKLCSHSPEGLGLGISTTPAVVIDGRIVAQGRVPEVQELKSIYTKMLGE